MVSALRAAALLPLVASLGALAGCGPSGRIAEASVQLSQVLPPQGDGLLQFTLEAIPCLDRARLSATVNGVEASVVGLAMNETPLPASRCEARIAVTSTLPASAETTLVVTDGESELTAGYADLALDEAIRLSADGGAVALHGGDALAWANRLTTRAVVDSAENAVRFSHPVPDAGGGSVEQQDWSEAPSVVSGRVETVAPARRTAARQEGTLALFVHFAPPPVLACEGFAGCTLPEQAWGYQVPASYEP